MLNNNITNILSQVNGITNSAVLKHPTTILNSAPGDIYVHIDIGSLDSDSFNEIGIYDISEFLSTFKLFSEDRKVQLDGTVINITDGNIAASYNSTNINLLGDFNKDLSVFTSTEGVPTVAEFILTSEDIKKMKQASGVFKDLEEVDFTSMDGTMNVSLSASNKFNAKSNTFKITKEAHTTKEFSVKIPVENFVKLPNGDYTVYVKYNSSKDAYRVLFNAVEIKNFKILMAVKK